LLTATALLFACAAEEEKEDKRPPGGRGRASVEELRVYVDEVKPEHVYTVRFKEPLRWKYLNDYFVIMETRNGPHLVELAWECNDLRGDIYADMADRREKRGILRANIDTIRGCRIESFYKLPARKAVETEVVIEPE
jgi:Family of unknown function (DUF6491)